MLLVILHVVDGPEIPSYIEGAVTHEAVSLPFVDDEGIWDWDGSRHESEDDGLDGDEM